jgi:Cu-Zn family superoxide dismutase
MLAIAAGACDRRDEAHEHTRPAPPAATDNATPAIEHAVAIIHATNGHQAHGTVRFERTGTGVAISTDVAGLHPNSQHAFHIHEVGDCSAPDAESAGDHFAPAGEKHGLPSDPEHHPGDFGNLRTNESGVAHAVATSDRLSLDPAHKSSVVGRSVVIHADRDDGSQPSGRSGKRIGCGVIGIANGKPST